MMNSISIPNKIINVILNAKRKQMFIELKY